MILGHERQIEYLNAVVRKGLLAHAYLFYGPEHVGKLTVAFHIAKLLHCEKNDENPCDKCRHCSSIAAGSHPQILLLDTNHTLLSKKEERKDIPIDDMRELKRIFSFAAEENRWRVVIINEAEKLSDEAANSFLKLLEEPGPQSLFILVSANPDLLPATIRSRAQAMHFPPLSDEKIRGLVQEKPLSKKEQDELIFFAAGRPGVILNLMENPPALERERKLYGYLTKFFLRPDLGEALRASERFSQNEELSQDAIAAILKIMRQDLLSAAKQKARNISEKIGKIKEVERISFLLATTNVNRRLALDALLLKAII